MKKQHLLLVVTVLWLIFVYFANKTFIHFQYDYKEWDLKSKLQYVEILLERDVSDEQEELQLKLDSLFGDYTVILETSKTYDTERPLVAAIRNDVNRYKIDSPDIYIQHLFYCAEKINTSPIFLDFVIKTESSRLKTARNDSSNATGLIQIIPKTAEYLDEDVDDIKNMSYEQQFKVIYKYLKDVKDSRKVNYDDPFTLYFAVFYPAWCKASSKLQLTDKEVNQNPGYDKYPKDGKITREEVVRIKKEQYEKYINDIDYFRNLDNYQLLNQLK